MESVQRRHIPDTIEVTKNGHGGFLNSVAHLGRTRYQVVRRSFVGPGGTTVPPLVDQGDVYVGWFDSKRAKDKAIRLAAEKNKNLLKPGETFVRVRKDPSSLLRFTKPGQYRVVPRK